MTDKESVKIWDKNFNVIDNLPSGLQSRVEIFGEHNLTHQLFNCWTNIHASPDCSFQLLIAIFQESFNQGCQQA